MTNLTPSEHVTSFWTSFAGIFNLWEYTTHSVWAPIHVAISWSARTDRRAQTVCASHAVYRFQNHKAGMEGPTSRLSEVCALSCRTVSVIYQGLIGRIVYCQLLPCAIVCLRVLSIHFHTDINNRHTLVKFPPSNCGHLQLLCIGDEIGKDGGFNNLYV